MIPSQFDLAFVKYIPTILLNNRLMCMYPTKVLIHCTVAFVGNLREHFAKLYHIQSP